MLRRGFRPERLACPRAARALVWRHPLRASAPSRPSVRGAASLARSSRSLGAPDPWRDNDHAVSPGFPDLGDTIYALSTSRGRAGIAVIRVSGPSCLNVYSALCPAQALPRPRYAAVRTLFEPQPAPEPVVLDLHALVLYFPGPRSVTGEDVLELHVHGGAATVKAVLAAIPRARSSHSVIRYAEPGEFTKRAFVHDRLDLGQVEALGDILAAETEQQRRAAVRGSSGALGRTYEAWRQQLLLARGKIEALIDFSEDQHFDESPTDLLDNVAEQVADMLRAMRLHDLAGQRGELLRNGIRIALLGPPNVGKSSLMNLIVGREASIVSGEAGTTRDIVEASLDLRGYLCAFADTAGFRSAAPADGGAIGAVEAEGIRRARRKAQDSEVVVALASVETGPQGPFLHYDLETLDLAAEADNRLIVVNKRDAVDDAALAALLTGFREILSRRHPALADAEPVAISCQPEGAPALSGADPGGIQGLVDSLAAAFSRMTDMPAHQQDLLGVTERQRQLLALCRCHLEGFQAEACADEPDVAPDVVLAAEYLRWAAGCLARVTGRDEAGDVEEVLGVVFEKFCVGK